MFMICLKNFFLSQIKQLLMIIRNERFLFDINGYLIMLPLP